MIKKIFSRMEVGATVVGIVSKNNKILLTKRRENLQEGGKWCLPGGHIEKGERAESALRRELKEETGLNVKNNKFLFYFDEIIPRLKINNIVLVFLTNVSGKERQSIEVSETSWFDEKEIEDIDMAFQHREILNKFFSKSF